MIEYAKHEARLSVRGADGFTVRESLEGYERMYGKTPDGLAGPDFPEQLRYLWDWYFSLRMGVGESMTWTALDAWSRHLKLELEPREVEALFYLDASWRNAQVPAK